MNTVPLPQRGPFRLDILVMGSSRWIPLTTSHTTLAEAEQEGAEWASEWAQLIAWRVVPTSHPEREHADFDATTNAGFPLSIVGE